MPVFGAYPTDRELMRILAISRLTDYVIFLPRGPDMFFFVLIDLPEHILRGLNLKRRSVWI